MIAFTAHGIPRPKGSKRAFAIRRKSGRMGVAVTEQTSAGLATWEPQLAVAVASVRPPGGPLEGPVMVSLDFRLPAPKQRRTDHPVARNRSDIDKLARVVLDQMVGILIVDDAQVVRLNAAKTYGTPGVDVRVYRVASNGAEDGGAPHTPRKEAEAPTGGRGAARGGRFGPSDGEVLGDPTPSLLGAVRAAGGGA
jgi:Holliday junction resolvase RusA-like endonuclease